MGGLKLLVSIAVTVGLAACATAPSSKPEDSASALVSRIDGASPYDASHGKCPQNWTGYCLNRTGLTLGEEHDADCKCVPREALRQRLEFLFAH